ncbi:MAG: hypothetical protein LBL00_00295 [Endomicrobium sp.]|jgi:hypothetical protein|nr:hypothetical protein [Endomicrobium sp.]
MNTKKILSLLISVCLIVSAVLPDHAVSSTLMTGKSTATDSLSILTNSASVIKSAIYDGSDILFINIQDIHNNPAIQSNILKTLNSISENLAVDKIYVEGASGAVNTSFLSNIYKTSPEYIEYFFNNGYISAGEYFSIISKGAKTLAGIEDKEIYDDNILKLNALISNRQKSSKELISLGKTLQNLYDVYASDKNKRFDAKLPGHERSSRNYYAFLVKTAAENGIPQKNYDIIENFINLTKLQKSINYSKVNANFSNILQELKAVMPYGKYAYLTESFAKENKDEFYILTAKYVDEYGLTTARQKDINLFFKYVSLKNTTDIRNVLRQEMSLISLIRMQLALSAAERDILFLLSYAEMLERYLRGEVTSDEYSYISLNEKRFGDTLAVFNIELSESITADLKIAASFYENNVIRNDIFINNILKDLKETKPLKNSFAVTEQQNYFKNIDLSGYKKIAVVVTGGFHTEGMNKILDINKISNITLMPVLGKSFQEGTEIYEALARLQEYALKNTIAANPLSNINTEFIVSKIFSQTIKGVLEKYPGSSADEMLKLINLALPETLIKAYLEAYPQESFDISLSSLNMQNGGVFDFTFNMTKNGVPSSFTYYVDGKNEKLKDSSDNIITTASSINVNIDSKDGFIKKAGKYLYLALGVNWEFIYSVPVLGSIVNEILSDKGLIEKVPHLKTVTVLFAFSFVLGLFFPYALPAVIFSSLASSIIGGYLFAETHSDPNDYLMILGSILTFALLTPVLAAPLFSISYATAALSGLSFNFIIHSLNNIASMVSEKFRMGSSITPEQKRNTEIDKFVRTGQNVYNSGKLKNIEDWLFDEQTSYESKIKLINYLNTWKYTGALAIIKRFIHQTLSAPEMTSREESLLNLAVRALSHIKTNGVLATKNVGKHISIIGSVYEVIDKYDDTRTKIYVKMNNNFSSFDILFDFPEDEPFFEGDAFSKDLIKALESFGGDNIKINYEITKQPEFNDDFTQGKMSIKFTPDIATLTSFWKSLAPHDFKVIGDADKKNMSLRAFTADEIYYKFLERSKNFYHEQKPILYDDDHFNNSFQKFLFGNGEFQGALAIVKNPEKFKDIRAFPAETLENSYVQNITKITYNEMIELFEDGKSNSVHMLRASNRYEDLVKLAQGNPYFAHYMPDDGVQHYVFLARGAGAAFTSAYMKGLLRGYSDSDSIFFISRDTFGRSNWEMVSKNIRSYVYNEKKKRGVVNFKALTFQILKDLKKQYFEEFEVDFDSKKFKIVHSHANNYYLLGANGEKLLKFTSDRKSISKREKFENAPEIGDDILLKAMTSNRYNDFRDKLDEVYENFLKTGIMNKLYWDGINPAKICVVDEIAVGTFDFVFKFVVEELSRQDPYEIDDLREKVNEKLGEDYWYLFDKDTFEFTEQEGELAEKLYKTINEIRAENSKKPVDSDIFIGRINRRLSDDQIIDGYPTLLIKKIMEDFDMTEEEANKLILNVSITADFAPHIVKINNLRPSQWQIEFEADWVLLEAYLKALLSYNGVIDYYNREYKRLAVETLKEMIDSDKTSLNTKLNALVSLQEFQYDSVIEYLESLISNNETDSVIKEKVASILDKTFDSYMQEMINIKMPVGDRSFIKNFSLLMENERFLKKLSLESSSNYIKSEIFKIFEAIDLRREKMRLIGIDTNSFATLKQHHVMALREMDFYLVPLRSDSEDEKRMDDFNTFKIKPSNWHFIRSMPENLSSEKIFDTIVETTNKEINGTNFVHAESMPVNPESDFYSKQPVYRGQELFATGNIDTSGYVKYEDISGLDTVFYVDPELKVDRQMLADAVTEALNRHDLRETVPKRIVISKLDRSEHLFEDHLPNGFIGINASVNKETAEHRIILQSGLFHELSHELTGRSGEEFETEQAKYDADYLQTLAKQKPKGLLNAINDPEEFIKNGYSRTMTNIIKVFDSVLDPESDNITNKLVRKNTEAAFAKPFFIISSAVFLFALLLMPAASPFNFGAGIPGLLFLLSSISAGLFSMIFTGEYFFQNRSSKLSSKPLLANPFILFAGIWMALSHVLTLPNFGYITDFLGPIALSAFFYDTVTGAKTLFAGYGGILKGIQKASVNMINAMIAAVAAGLFGIGFEIAQLLGWDVTGDSSGTYDPLDLLAFSAGSAVVLAVIGLYHKNGRFNNFAPVINFIEKTVVGKNELGKSISEYFLNIDASEDDDDVEKKGIETGDVPNETAILIKNIIYREKRNRKDIGRDIYDVYMETLEKIYENAASYKKGDIDKKTFVNNSLELRKNLRNHILSAGKKQGKKQSILSAPIGVLKAMLMPQADTKTAYPWLKGKNYFIYDNDLTDNNLQKAFELYESGLNPYLILPKPFKTDLLSQGFVKMTLNGVGVYAKTYKEADTGRMATAIVIDNNFAGTQEAQKIIEAVQNDPVARSSLIDPESKTALYAEKYKKPGIAFIELSNVNDHDNVFSSHIKILSGQNNAGEYAGMFDYFNKENVSVSPEKLESLYLNALRNENYNGKMPKTLETIDCLAFNADSLKDHINEHSRNGMKSFVLVNPSKEHILALSGIIDNINIICDYSVTESEDMQNLKNRLLSDIDLGISGYRINFKTGDITQKQALDFMNDLKSETEKIDPDIISAIGISAQQLDTFETYAQNGHIVSIKASPNDDLSDPRLLNLWVEISLDGLDMYENQRGIETKLKDLSNLQSKMLSLDTALFVGEKVNGNLTFVSVAVAQRVRFFTGSRSESELMSQEDIFKKSHDQSMQMPAISIKDLSSFAVLLKNYYLLQGKGTDAKAADKLFKELENFTKRLKISADNEAALIFLETNIEKYKSSSDHAEKTAYISEIMGFLYAMAQDSIVTNDALTNYRNIYTSLKLEAWAILGGSANDSRSIERLTRIAETNPQDNEAVKNINKLLETGINPAEIEDEIIKAINSMFNSSVNKQNGEINRARAIASSLYLFQLLIDYKLKTDIDEVKNDIYDSKKIFAILNAA